jgi:hypothetical protein
MWLNKFSLPYYNLANMLKTQSFFLALYENQSLISTERMNPILIEINPAHNIFTYIALSSHTHLGLPSGFFASGSRQEFFWLSHFPMLATFPPILSFQPKILISTIFFLQDTDKISHPRTTIDKIIFLYILIFIAITNEASKIWSKHNSYTYLQIL